MFRRSARAAVINGICKGLVCSVLGLFICVGVNAQGDGGISMAKLFAYALDIRPVCNTDCCHGMAELVRVKMGCPVFLLKAAEVACEKLWISHTAIISSKHKSRPGQTQGHEDLELFLVPFLQRSQSGRIKNQLSALAVLRCGDIAAFTSGILTITADRMPPCSSSAF